jgi:hypothetical protein
MGPAEKPTPKNSGTVARRAHRGLPETLGLIYQGSQWILLLRNFGAGGGCGWGVGDKGEPEAVGEIS